MNRIATLFVFAAFVLSACDSKPAQQEPAPAQIEAAPSVAQAPVAPPPAATAPRTQHSGSGTVTEIQDAGYPAYIITIALQTGEGVALTANAEELGLGAGIEALKGKSVDVSYETYDEAILMDLLSGGASLLGSSAPPRHALDWKQVTGRLSGASRVVGGDLPDTITVTPGALEPVSFSYFVDDALVKAEGKTVTAYYEMRAAARITALKPR